MIHFVLLVSLAYPRIVAKEISQRSGNWISSRPEVETVRGKGTYWAGSESQEHVPGQDSRLSRIARYMYRDSTVDWIGEPGTCAGTGQLTGSDSKVHVPGEDSRLGRIARYMYRDRTVDWIG